LINFIGLAAKCQKEDMLIGCNIAGLTMLFLQPEIPKRSGKKPKD
jgi:hypothetical protein